MPSKGRPLFNVRLSEEDADLLIAEAERLGVTRSDVIRAALAKWATLPKRERKIDK